MAGVGIKQPQEKLRVQFIISNEIYFQFGLPLLMCTVKL